MIRSETSFGSRILRRQCRVKDCELQLIGNRVLLKIFETGNDIKGAMF